MNRNECLASDKQNMSNETLKARDAPAAEGDKKSPATATACSQLELKNAAFRQMITSKSATGTSSTPVADSQKNNKKKIRAKDRILIPSDKDVLFGRGRPYQNHPGNKKLHALVEVHRDQYLRSKRFDKNIIAKKIVQMIKHSSARFLKRAGEDKDFWVVVSDGDAREKVSTILRSKVRTKALDSKTGIVSVPEGDTSAASSRVDHMLLPATGMPAAPVSELYRAGAAASVAKTLPPTAGASPTLLGAPAPLSSSSLLAKEFLPAARMGLGGGLDMAALRASEQMFGRRPLLRDSSLAFHGLPMDFGALSYSSALATHPYGALEMLHRRGLVDDWINLPPHSRLAAASMMAPSLPLPPVDGVSSATLKSPQAADRKGSP